MDHPLGTGILRVGRSVAADTGEVGYCISISVGKDECRARLTRDVLRLLVPQLQRAQVELEMQTSKPKSVV